MHMKTPKKEPSMYQKLKSIYETSLVEMSETDYARSKKWHGTFFDTKVGQRQYFECICGSELPEHHDDKYRVQCNKCQLWQHAECVRYDLRDPYRYLSCH